MSEYNKNRNINVTEIISLLNNDSDGSLIWKLVSKFQDRCIDIFAEISDIAFPLALKEAQIIEYVADNVQRYKIRSLANSIKADDKSDGHIRAQISYFEGY